MEKYKFGTDGIRGKANEELTPEIAFRLGYVLGKRIPEGERLLVSKDTRESGDELALSAISGCLASGKDVDYIKVAATPISAFATTYLNYSYALVITASHNIYSDNGLKVFKKNGLKLSDEECQSIEQELTENISYSKKIGKLFIKKNIKKKYINYLKKQNINLDSLTVVLDEANGSLSNYASKVFKLLNAKVKVINNKPNGQNINYKSGSTNIEYLIKEKLNYLLPFDIGFSFDGDIEALLLVKLLRNNSGLILTKMSDIAIIKYLKQSGINISISDVGDKNVYELMNNSGCKIGAEKSGHIILKDYMNSGDGLYNALLLASIFKKNKEEFYRVVKQIKASKKYEIEIITDNAKEVIKNSNFEKIAQKYDGLNENKFVYRASGTESKIRVLIQSLDEKELKEMYIEINEEIERLKEKYVWNSRNIVVKKS